MTVHMKSDGNPLAAAASAYGDTFLVAAGIAALGALVALILRKPKALPGDSEEGAGQAQASMMAGH
ncbi:hypothetical protein D3C81_2091560 [compost metagenome]